ncbi:MAG: hypothetical protein NXH83_05585 [Rhodobacteraceae bacterium]|nr:hypothetical protein [Paracoccaceae bacterium]
MPVHVVTSEGVRARAARRGVTLVEAILYLSVSFSVITFTAQTLVRERDRQEETLVAGDLRQHLASAQGYVAARYDRILGALYDGTSAGDPLALNLGLNDVVASGYLPSVYANNEGALQKVYGQEFTVLARAVLRSAALAAAPGAPAPTANRNDVEQAGGGAIRADLTDRVFDLSDPANENDEIDLEVLLVTTGGQPASTTRGNRIVASARMPSAGFIRPIDAENPNDGIEAVGPYGAWTLNVTPFQEAGLLGESGAGYFGSLVALSNFGSVSADPADVSEKVEAEETLSRCSGLPAGSEDHERCLSGNGLYDSLVFNAWDSDGDGEVDRFPGISGVNSIVMSDLAGAEASISGLRTLAMAGAQAAITGLAELRTAEAGLALANPDGEPAAVSGIGTLEMAEGRIDRLLGISCTAGGATNATPGGLQIDCPETRLSGTLIAAGAARVAALTVEGDATVEGALEVAGDTALAGNLTVGAAGTAGGDVTVAGTVAANDARFSAGLSAGETQVAALTVGGTRADRTILMSSGIEEFDGGAIRVAKPACGQGFAPDIVAMPISFEAGLDKGSAYDRGTEVPPNWQNSKDWPMQRHKNQPAPGQLVGIETEIDSSGSDWKVSLKVMRRAWFNDVTVDTATNPDGARMMIQTLCRNDSGA